MHKLNIHARQISEGEEFVGTSKSIVHNYKCQMNDEPENCPSDGWRISVKNEPMNELEEFEVMDSKWIDNEIILVTLISGKI